MPAGVATEQEVLRAAGRLLGLLGHDPAGWFHSGADEKHIARCIADRLVARRERRFTDADRIRAELAAEGVILEDKPDGTTEWRRA